MKSTTRILAALLVAAGTAAGAQSIDAMSDPVCQKTFRMKSHFGDYLTFWQDRLYLTTQALGPGEQTWRMACAERYPSLELDFVTIYLNRDLPGTASFRVWSNDNAQMSATTFNDETSGRQDWVLRDLGWVTDTSGKQVRRIELVSKFDQMSLHRPDYGDVPVRWHSGAGNIWTLEFQD